MYVWSRASLFYAVAQAESVEKARAALLEEIEGKGATDAHKDAMEWIRNQGPSIWHGQNSEFALTDSVELRLSDECNSELREEIKNLKQQLAQAQASLAAARAQAYEEAAKLTEGFKHYYSTLDSQGMTSVREDVYANTVIVAREIRALITPSDSTALANPSPLTPYGEALREAISVPYEQKSKEELLQIVNWLREDNEYYRQKLNGQDLAKLLAEERPPKDSPITLLVNALHDPRWQEESSQIARAIADKARAEVDRYLQIPQTPVARVAELKGRKDSV